MKSTLREKVAEGSRQAEEVVLDCDLTEEIKWGKPCFTYQKKNVAIVIPLKDDEWVTRLLRQGDSQVFKRYLQMKLQMKREALEKINRRANEMPLTSRLDSGTVAKSMKLFWHS